MPAKTQCTLRRHGWMLPSSNLLSMHTGNVVNAWNILCNTLKVMISEHEPMTLIYITELSINTNDH